ncbi:MAG: hypothetical protein ACPH5P_00225 [Akkermansiaceae bacterium]
MTNDASIRKQTPIYSGVLKYFPLAIAEIAQCSFIANEQHNPGSVMHWDRSKSGDELDALCRHLMEAGTCDTDGIRHSTKVAWRGLANLEKELEMLHNTKSSKKSREIAVGEADLLIEKGEYENH